MGSLGDVGADCGGCMVMEGTGIGGGGGALVETTGAVIFASGLLDGSVWVDVEQYSAVGMGIEFAGGTSGDGGVEIFGVAGGWEVLR